MRRSTCCNLPRTADGPSLCFGYLPSLLEGRLGAADVGTHPLEAAGWRMVGGETAEQADSEFQMPPDTLKFLLSEAVLRDLPQTSSRACIARGISRTCRGFILVADEPDARIQR